MKKIEETPGRILNASIYTDPSFNLTNINFIPQTNSSQYTNQTNGTVEEKKTTNELYNTGLRGKTLQNGMPPPQNYENEESQVTREVPLSKPLDPINTTQSTHTATYPNKAEMPNQYQSGIVTNKKISLGNKIPGGHESIDINKFTTGTHGTTGTNNYTHVSIVDNEPAGNSKQQSTSTISTQHNPTTSSKLNDFNTSTTEN